MDTVEIVYVKSNVRESISTSRNIYELYDITNMLPVSCKLDIFGGGIFLLHNYILASLLLLYDHNCIITKIKCLHTD